MEYKIYKLSHPITKEVRYIGYTKLDLDVRLKYHLKESKNPKSKTTHKINWIRSLIEDGLNPIIELIENTMDYSNREIFWIEDFKSKGYNLTNGTIGGDGRHGPLPESAKQKISLFNKGKILSQETKDKISQANKGRIFTEDHKKKLGARIVSDETKTAIRNSRLGKPMSEDTKKKLSESLKNKIFPSQLENLEKARAARTLKGVSQFALDGTHIRDYTSSIEAERETNIKRNLILDTCNNKQRSSGGFIWKFKDI